MGILTCWSCTSSYVQQHSVWPFQPETRSSLLLHLCVCVCVYMCVCVCVCARAHLFAPLCEVACVCVCTCVCVCVCAYLSICVKLRARVCVCVQECVHIYLSICVKLQVWATRRCTNHHLALNTIKLYKFIDHRVAYSCTWYFELRTIFIHTDHILHKPDIKQALVDTYAYTETHLPSKYKTRHQKYSPLCFFLCYIRSSPAGVFDLLGHCSAQEWCFPVLDLHNQTHFWRSQNRADEIRQSPHHYKGHFHYFRSALHSSTPKRRRCAGVCAGGTLCV